MSESISPEDTPKSGSPTVRRFNLGDAMILTAAIAALFAMPRDVYLRFLRSTVYLYHSAGDWAFNRQPTSPRGGYWGRPVRYSSEQLFGFLISDAVEWIDGAGTLLLILLVVATPTAFAMRFRKPRPSLDVLKYQPGAAALLAAMVAFGISFNCHWNFGVPKNPAWILWSVGGSVLIVSLILKIRGLARPEASWIDRTGRLIGLGWIVVTIYFVAMRR